MLSKSQISFLKSLHQKKFRKEHGLFIVEGIKSISEFINSDYIIQSIYCVENSVPNLPKLSQKQKVFEISESDLTKISALQTPQEAFAVIEIPNSKLNLSSIQGKMILVLDGVQDPGNLGTIIRTADWYGFNQIICSNNTVEAYNPKVVQATMGSLARVKVLYLDIFDFLKTQKAPKYGTLLNGENIFSIKWPEEGFLILGSEGNGISKEIISLLDHSVTIPGAGNTESLNVAIAAAISCTEIMRNFLK